MLTESLTAVSDCFRIALQNCGNAEVQFTNDKLMKRRKSRVHKLDVPAGMHRNMSESQLVQAGSKAVSNVAEQFSKLGQTFNPKILTGKRASFSKEASTDSEKPEDIPIHAADMADSTGEGESVCSDNSFLQSVGIVMVDAGKLGESSTAMGEPRKPKVLLKNVSKMSISSVTDNINMPQEMLDIGDANVAAEHSIAPVISVQETDDIRAVPNEGLKMCHSVSDIRSDPNYDIDDGTR